jgi:cobalamin biosynthesis protein CobD/CbiB
MGGAHDRTGAEETMPDRRTLGHIAVLSTIAAIEWLLVSVPATLGATDLVLFLGPATLIGIAFAWLASLGRREDERWTRIALGALYAAMFLPPVLATSVAIAGTAGPAGILSLFVFGAWVTVLLGGAVAAGRMIRSHVVHRRATRDDPHGARAIGSAARRRRTS